VVVLARRKLRHYFEAHPVTVVSSFSLGEIIQNPDAAGRIAKWSIELMGETLAYAPRRAIKSQSLENFVAEWTDTQLPSPQIQAECWTLYFDGSVMKTGAGVGLLFISPLGEHMRYAVRLHFPTSNNMAEYEALLCGLKIAIEIGIKRLDVRGDSQLVIDQVMKTRTATTIRWRRTARPCGPSRTSSMASNSTTCPAGITRRRTSSPRSRRGGSPSPRMSSLGTSPSRPLTSNHTPRTARNPRGLPRIQQARSPWTRTPRTRRTCSPCSRGTVPTRPRPWTSNQPPARWTGTTSISPGWVEGNFPQTGPRPGASPGWPSPLLSSTASCISAPPPTSCSDACPSPRGASSSGGYTRGRMRQPRRAPHPRGKCVPPGLLLAHRGR
jgi:hypothetical protein